MYCKRGIFRHRLCPFKEPYSLGCGMLAVDIKPIPVKGITGVKTFSADLSNQEGIDALFEEAAKELGEIDIFIANAGFAYCERTDTPDWNHIERIFELNVVSPIYSLEKLRALKGHKPFFFITTASAMSFMSLRIRDLRHHQGGVAYV